MEIDDSYQIKKIDDTPPPTINRKEPVIQFATVTIPTPLPPNIVFSEPKSDSTYLIKFREMFRTFDFGQFLQQWTLCCTCNNDLYD